MKFLAAVLLLIAVQGAFGKKKSVKASKGQ